MSEKAERHTVLICDADEFVATGELRVIGSMTGIEKECRDSWAAADPERVTWTASRFNRLPLPFSRGR